MRNELLIKLKGYQFIKKDENSIGYYNYAEYVDDIFKEVVGEAVYSDYTSKYEEFKNKDVSTLNLEEIKIYFFYIRRGEKFCDGHIARYLEDGTFVKLYERYLELC